jgi:hypothetical protein
MPSVIFPLPFEAYEGTEPYIFVSYAHSDAKDVYEDIQFIHELGYRIWYDEGIDPGNEWSADIEKAIIGCSCFIVFISPQSVASQNVCDEINLALNLKKYFVAIHITETQLPLGLNLRMQSKQAIFKYKQTSESFPRKIKKTLSIKLREENEPQQKEPEVKRDPVAVPVVERKKRTQIAPWAYIGIILGLAAILAGFGNWLTTGFGMKPSSSVRQLYDQKVFTITPGISQTQSILGINPTETSTIAPTGLKAQVTADPSLWKEGNQLFADTFDNGKATNWEFVGLWDVVKDEKDNFVLQKDGPQASTAKIINSETWQNYAFEAQVKGLFYPRINFDVFDVFFRVQDYSPRYHWNVKTSSISIFSDGNLLQSKFVLIPLNTWFKIRLEVINDHIRGFLNDTQISDLSDTHLPVMGGAYIAASPDVKIVFDNVRVVELIK